MIVKSTSEGQRERKVEAMKYYNVTHTPCLLVEAIVRYRSRENSFSCDSPARTRRNGHGTESCRKIEEQPGRLVGEMTIISVSSYISTTMGHAQVGYNVHVSFIVPLKAPVSLVHLLTQRPLSHVPAASSTASASFHEEFWLDVFPRTYSGRGGSSSSNEKTHLRVNSSCSMHRLSSWFIQTYHS